MQSLAYKQQRLWKQPWFYSILLLCAIPLFPDFITFVLCIAAFLTACADAYIHRAPVSLGRTGFSLVIILFLAACSILYATDRANTLGTVGMWICMFLCYLTVTTVLRDRSRFFTALSCMVGSMGLVGGVTVLQYVLRETFRLPVGSKLWEGLEFSVYTWLQFPMENVDFGDRVSGTFHNPNLLATCLIVCLPFCITFLLCDTAKRKAPSRLAVILGVYALGFSFCRGAYLAMIAIGCLLAVLYIRKKFITTLLVTIYIVLLVPTSVGNRLVSILPGVDIPPATQSEVVAPPVDTPQISYAHDESINNRFTIWKTVAEDGLKTPLLGSGFGIGSTRRVLLAANLDFPHAHNLFLELFAEGGLLLLAAFGALAFLLVRRGWLLLWRCQAREARLFGFAVLAVCGSIFVLGLFDFPLSTPRTIAAFMVFAGLTEIISRLYLQVPTFEPFVRRTKEK